MSKGEDKGIGRLWSGVTQRKEVPKADKVLPMERPPAPRKSDDRTYAAFDVRNRAKRLEICRAADPSRFPAYGYLLDISYDRFRQAAFSIIYTFMVVHVDGRNLNEVVRAISLGNAGRITEFNAREYDKPGAGEALIERIEIIAADEQLTKARREK